MVRPLHVSDASELQDALSHELRHCEYARYLNRLHCLLLVGHSRTCYEVAEWFGESPRTLERWIHRFEEDGLDGLKDRRCTSHGGSRKLTRPQLNSLRQDLRKNPREVGYPSKRWNGPLVLEHLENAYGIRFSLRHCQRLLREHRS